MRLVFSRFPVQECLLKAPPLLSLWLNLTLRIAAAFASLYCTLYCTSAVFGAAVSHVPFWFSAVSAGVIPCQNRQNRSYSGQSAVVEMRAHIKHFVLSCVTGVA